MIIKRVKEMTFEDLQSYLSYRVYGNNIMSENDKKCYEIYEKILSESPVLLFHRHKVRERLWEKYRSRYFNLEKEFEWDE